MAHKSDDIIYRSKVKKPLPKGSGDGSWTRDAYGNPVWIPKGSKPGRRPAGFPGHSKKIA